MPGVKGEEEEDAEEEDGGHPQEDLQAGEELHWKGRVSGEQLLQNVSTQILRELLNKKMQLNYGLLP